MCLMLLLSSGLMTLRLYNRRDYFQGKNKQEYKYYVEKNSPYECAQTNRLCINGSMNLIISANEDRQIRFYEEKQSKLELIKVNV